MKYRIPYEPHERVTVATHGKSHVQQQFKDECDINHIMKRFEKTGLLPDMIKQNPAYGDFTDVGTYHEACNVVVKAREQFQALSAKVRDRFGNDPEKFLEFVGDAKNAEEMVELGLAVKRASEGNLEENTSPAGKGSKKKVAPTPEAEG